MKIKHLFSWLLIITAILLFNDSLLAQKKITGCSVDTIADNRMSKFKYPVTRGETLPSRISLKRYTPKPGSQGNIGNCTAWSVAYSGLTTLYRAQMDRQDVQAFSPYCLYSRVKAMSQEDPCSDGSAYEDNLRICKSYGCEVLDRHFDKCDYESATKSFITGKCDYRRLDVDFSFRDIKAALNQKHPVLIAMGSYKTFDWGDNANIINGVWNGVYDKSSRPSSSHAMCIIGYDDYKAGGAFEIMNSWGEDWGDKGYFWVRYEDMSLLEQAFELLPPDGGVRYFNDPPVINRPPVIPPPVIKPPDFSVVDDFEIIDGLSDLSINGSSVYIMNPCNENVFFALSLFERDSWRTYGWEMAAPGAYIEVDISSRTRNMFQWTAMNSSGSLKWYDESGDASKFCIDTDSHFSFRDVNPAECEESIGFYKMDPSDQDNDIVMLEIGCATNTSRGGTVSMGHTISSFKLDSLDSEKSNHDWKKGLLLQDLMTGKLIMPRTEGQTKMYSVWSTDGTSKPVFTSIDESGLEALKAYKFASENSAEAWLKSRQQ